MTSYQPSRSIVGGLGGPEDDGYGLFTLDLEVTGEDQQKPPTITDSQDELVGLIRKASLDSLFIDMDEDGKLSKSPSASSLLNRTPSNVAIDNMLAELEGGAKLPHEPWSPRQIPSAKPSLSSAKPSLQSAKSSAAINSLKRLRTQSHDNLVAMETPNRANGFGQQAHRPRRSSEPPEVQHHHHHHHHVHQPPTQHPMYQGFWNSPQYAYMAARAKSQSAAMAMPSSGSSMHLGNNSPTSDAFRKRSSTVPLDAAGAEPAKYNSNQNSSSSNNSSSNNNSTNSRILHSTQPQDFSDGSTSPTTLTDAMHGQGGRPAAAAAHPPMPMDMNEYMQRMQAMHMRMMAAHGGYRGSYPANGVPMGMYPQMNGMHMPMSPQMSQQFMAMQPQPHAAHMASSSEGAGGVPVAAAPPTAAQLPGGVGDGSRYGGGGSGNQEVSDRRTAATGRL